MLPIVEADQAVRVDGRGADAVITGDLIHSPIQYHYPHRNCRYDANQPLAADTRRSFLERYSDCATQVLTAHVPLPSAGSVKREGDACRCDYWPNGRLI